MVRLLFFLLLVTAMSVKIVYANFKSVDIIPIITMFVLDDTSTPNHQPVAKNDSYLLAKDSATAINVLANDSDSDGDTLSITAVTQPSHGTVVISNGKIIYTPTANYTGSDTFTYTLKDSHGATRSATVTVYVTQECNLFPSSYYPTTTRPRLWLTQKRLDILTNQKNSNTQLWHDFKAMCDSMLDSDPDNDPYGYPGSAQNFTAPLALMYLLTNESKYANKALELMDAVNTNLSRYGDPDHQSWYFMALTYDWLHNYVGMSESRKKRYQSLMHELSDKFWNNFNINASGTDSDQNLLTGMMHLAFGAALYGDDTDAVELLNRGWYGWRHGYFVEHGISNKGIIQAALGGVYFTGMAYFPSTDIIGIASYEMTLKTACNYDVNIQESDIKDFWSNTTKAIIALTEPNRAYIDNYGSWQDPNSLTTQPWMRRAMILLEFFSAASGDTTTASLAKGYYDNVDIGYNNDYFLELFFTKEGISATNPYSANLPLIQFFHKSDYLLFRDSWASSANWGEFRGDGSIPLDQQAPDHGHFSIYKNGSYLTKAARNYEALSHGEFFNTLSIQNNCSLNGESCSGTAIFDSNKSAEITRHMEHNTSPLFAYAMLNADGQWNDNAREYNPVDNVISYRRHFFWTPKYIVILDRLRTKVPLNIRYRLRALQEPTISGNMVTQLSQNSNAKLIQKTLEPDNITINKLNESVAWSSIPDWVVDNSQRAWQSYINFAQKDSLNILNLIQTGDASLSNMDSNEHVISNTHSGVHIGNWVVMLSQEEMLQSQVDYTLHNSSVLTYHLIGDLESGDYRLEVDGVNKGTVTVSQSSHCAFFETTTAKSSLHISLVKL